MYKTSIKLIVLSTIIYFGPMLNAHEIHMKDGRVIESKSVWEEDGIVKYQKYGATI